MENNSHRDLTISRILLGTIGIEDKVNEQIAALNPIITALAEKGLLKAMPVRERRGGWVGRWWRGLWKRIGRPERGGL